MNLRVMKINSVNEKKFLDFLEKENIDLIFNLRSREIFQKEILKKVKILNLHHGILPENRGLFSDMRNLAFGGELGFSIHQVNEKIDAGKIFLIKKIDYKKDKNYLNYLKFSSKIEAKILPDFVFNLEENLKQGQENFSENFKFYKNPN
jgi:methionyl-tRNA formyltransferase